MGLTVNSMNPRKEELKPKSGQCQVPIQPVKIILPNNYARGSSERKWKILALTMGFCVMVLLFMSALLLWRDSYTSNLRGIPTPDYANTDDDDRLAPILPRIITRPEWGAKPPTETRDNLELPVPFVVISHTDTEFCHTQPNCSLLVRNIQKTYFEVHHYADIGFNFLLGGDGNVYEGRGWDFVGAHTLTYNKRSVGISFIGNFSTAIPTDRQIQAAQQLIELGVYKGKLEPDYKLIGHRQNHASNTTSPGDVLYNIIKTWPHWVPVTVSDLTF